MRVVAKVVTSATADVVWRTLIDVEHWRDWTPTVTEITPLGGARMQPGARYRVVQPKLRPAIYQVSEYVADQRFTWEQHVAGGALVADHRIRPSDGGTEVELSFASRGLLATVIASLFSKIIAQYVATEAQSLKAYCDALSYRRAS